MALIAVATAGFIRTVATDTPTEARDLPAAEAIVAGAPVRLDTTAGKFTNANGTGAAEARVWGVATNSAAAGETVNAVRRGLLDGFTFSQNYDAAIYLADTDGRLGDAAGTVSVVVGRVWPGTSSAPYDKLLSVEL